MCTSISNPIINFGQDMQDKVNDFKKWNANPKQVLLKKASNASFNVKIKEEEHEDNHNSNVKSERKLFADRVSFANKR